MTQDINTCGYVVRLPYQNVSTSPPLHPSASAGRFPARLRELHGASDVMQNLFHLVSRVAPTQANVLVVGESGTGKEVVANTIHQLSKAGDLPFIALNCGAVSPQLIEAELFGHERGSFTSAVRMHKGCFERANGGTLFLDEVTEMSAEMQVKLLRALETGRFYRVGGDEEIHVKVRVIAATNRDPQDAIASGKMRSDLFYRLAVFPIEVPALRERGQDIDLLAKLFLDRLNAEEQTSKFFSKTSVRFMREYHWPGNIRELKNVVQRAFILADQELDIPAVMGPLKPALPNVHGDCVMLQLGSGLAEAEHKLIRATLAHCGGNKTLTAEMLGVSLKTLYNRLKEYEAKAFMPHPASARAGIIT